MMTTLAALAVAFWNNNEDMNDPMSYIFPNSAMFVAFVIQAAFIGNAFELLAPGDLLRKLLRIEGDGISVPQFHFGLSYAFCLTFFSISLFYCILVPIMAPVALTFFVLRYLVDKHNLLYRCRRGPDGLLNRTFLRSVIAVHFFCLGIFDLGLILFLISKSGGVTSVGFAVVLLIITIGIYLYLVLFVWGRRAGTSHFEGEEEDKMVSQDDVEYTHPLTAVFEKMQQHHSGE